jgi:transcriptional regulator with XRE-family HTH domain
MPTPDPLLAELRTLRVMLGIRHEDIARRAHVNESSVSYWECGHRSPHLDKLRPYAAAVGFDLALVPLEPDSTASGALSTWIRTVTAQRDRAAAERDALVRAIAGLMSLTPAAVATAYGVAYTAEETITDDH